MTELMVFIFRMQPFYYQRRERIDRDDDDNDNDDAKYESDDSYVSKPTKAVAVVISVPPEAPVTNTVDPLLSKTIVGHMEDIGLFPGSMWLLGEAGTP